MILYRYIIREHILPFLYALGVIVFLFMMQLAVQLLRDILYKGLDLAVIVELFAVNTAWMMVLAVPMAVMVSSLMTFGRMSADNEIMAVKASGRNLLTLLIPVLLAAGILAVGLVAFHNRLLPDANHRSAALISDISRKKPAALIEPGVLIKDFTGYALMVDAVDISGGRLKGIKIFTDVSGQDRAVLVADSGLIELTKDSRWLQLTLFDGASHSLGRMANADYMVARFTQQKIFIENIDSRLRRTDREYRGDREKSADMLLADVKVFEQQLNASMVGYHRRVADVSAAALTLDSLARIAKPSNVVVPDSVKTFASWRASLAPQSDPASRELYAQANVARVTASDVKRQKQKIAQYLVEFHKKYATSAACIVFVLIGAPLGIMARRGGLGVGVSYSIFFFVLYWAALIWGENLADHMVVPPAIAMWSANAMIGLIGTWLLIRMVKENTSISFAWLARPFTALFARFRRGSRAHGRGFGGIMAALPRLVLQPFMGRLPSWLFVMFMSNLILILIGLGVLFVVIDYVSNLNKFTGATLAQVGEYYWYYCAWFINVICPIGVLLAAMFAITMISRTSELTGVRAAGISIRRLTAPLLVFALLISVGSFYLGEEILPGANARRNDLTEEIRTGIPAAGSRTDPQKSGRTQVYRNFYFFADKSTTYSFDDLRVKPFSARGVSRISFSGDSIAARIDAAGMTYANGHWSFVNAVVRTFEAGVSKARHVDTLADTMLSVTPEKMVTPIKEIAELSYWEMSEQIKAARARGEDVSRYQADLDFKVSLPFMNFIVMMLGLAITARAGRKGGAVAFGIGLALVFTYWVGSQFVLALGKNGTLDPTVSAWLGNVLFFFIGLYLYRRASR